MGEDVSYQSGSWDDMGRAIAQISGWGGALERMRQMDRTLQQIQKAIDDLDEDRRLWFSYKSQAGALDKLGDDYQKLGTFTGEAGNAVSRQIDDPFYKQMDAFAAEMAQVSISQYHTPNTLNVKEYQAASPLASVAAYEPVTKQSITFDDLFNSSSLMAASLKKEYEAYRAAAGKQAGDVTFDQYKEGIQYSRGFDYRSIKDKQMDREFWVNLGIGAAVVILTIACPPAGIAAGAAYGAMQLADAATGTSLISGRKLSTEERVTEGVFGVLDVIPAFKAAGAFSAIGRMGTKGVTTLGDLTKTMSRASGRRLLELKQAAANAGDGISLGGLRPEFAGASGVGGAGGGERFVDNLRNIKQSVQQIYSKNIGSMSTEKNNVNRLVPGKPGIVTGGDSSKLGKNLMEEMGIKRSARWSGYQAQHIIPAEMSNNPVIKKIGMDLDSSSNGIFLRIPGDNISAISRHRGYHSIYNEVVARALNKMDINQSVDSLQKQVYNLQKNLRKLQEKGLPLYPNQGATVDLWERKLKQLKY